MNNSENNSSSSTIGIFVGVVLLLGCFCLLLLGVGGYAFYTLSGFTPSQDSPVFADPFNPDVPQDEGEIIRPPVESISNETLETLESTIVPENDPRVLACRLDGKCNVPEVIAESAVPRALGDKKNFWVHDLDSNENNEIQATLRYITPHVYFWVQDGVDVDEDEVKALVEAFENEIYPTNREFFGSEWSPGIDGDEHIYILYSSSRAGSIRST